MKDFEYNEYFNKQMKNIDPYESDLVLINLENKSTNMETVKTKTETSQLKTCKSSTGSFKNENLSDSSLFTISSYLEEGYESPSLTDLRNSIKKSIIKREMKKSWYFLFLI